MKVLIISDIHGGYDNLKKVIDDNKNFDYLLILGDILSGYSERLNDLIELLNSYNTKIIAVRGNCDNYNIEKLDFSLDNYYVLVPIDNRIFFMTHGHLYDRYSDLNTKYDVYIQGHTHVPIMNIENDILYLNPGSITLPRGGSEKSYILYEDNTFYLKKVEDNSVIKKITLV